MDIIYLRFCFISLLLMLILISTILIFRTKSDDIDYDKIISYLEKQKEKNLIDLKYGNKEINDIEKQILNYKKKLGIKKFKSKK